MYFNHFQITAESEIKLDFFCDNQALLKRVARALNQAWINPSHCLASDYDLKSNNDIILELPIKMTLHHVKSHKDDVVDASLLPWEAQMNVSAD
jgi:hypothetical protein